MVTTRHDLSSKEFMIRSLCEIIFYRTPFFIHVINLGGKDFRGGCVVVFLEVGVWGEDQEFSFEHVQNETFYSTFKRDTELRAESGVHSS